MRKNYFSQRETGREEGDGMNPWTVYGSELGKCCRLRQMIGRWSLVLVPRQSCCSLPRSPGGLGREEWEWVGTSVEVGSQPTFHGGVGGAATAGSTPPPPTQLYNSVRQRRMKGASLSGNGSLCPDGIGRGVFTADIIGSFQMF